MADISVFSSKNGLALNQDIISQQLKEQKNSWKDQKNLPGPNVTAIQKSFGHDL